MAWEKYTGFKLARGSGYGVRHIWGEPWNPDAFTAGWNLCYMPYWAGMLTEDQHQYPPLKKAIQQASWELYFEADPVCAPLDFVEDTGPRRIHGGAATANFGTYPLDGSGPYISPSNYCRRGRRRSRWRTDNRENKENQEKRSSKLVESAQSRSRLDGPTARVIRDAKRRRQFEEHRSTDAKRDGTATRSAQGHTRFDLRKRRACGARGTGTRTAAVVWKKRPHQRDLPGLARAGER